MDLFQFLIFQMKLSILVLLFCVLNVCYGKSVGPLKDKRPIWFNETIPNKFGAKGFGGTWINDKEFTFSENGNLMKFNTEIKESTSTVFDKTFAVSI